MPGWHYETAAEARARAQKRKSMTKEQYRKYENEEQRKFNANPENRKKDKNFGKTKRRILGGSGGS